MDAANSPRTTRDALIYDLLGDVGRLEEKIKSLPATLNNALEPTKKELRDIQSNILKQIAALPGAADKEAKRANDAVISSLGKEVGRIAQQIAGNAAEATAPHNYSPANVGNDASARPFERQATQFDAGAAGAAGAGGSMIGSALGGSQS